jgi:NTE family protein
VKQIIVPLVEIAKDDMKIFDNIYNIKVDKQGRPVYGPDGKPEKKRSLLRVEFDIPDDYWPELLDWSSSNVRRLFRIGREAGERFLENPDNRKALGI